MPGRFGIRSVLPTLVAATVLLAVCLTLQTSRHVRKRKDQVVSLGNVTSQISRNIAETATRALVAHNDSSGMSLYIGKYRHLVSHLCVIYQE